MCSDGSYARSITNSAINMPPAQDRLLAIIKLESLNNNFKSTLGI